MDIHTKLPDASSFNKEVDFLIPWAGTNYSNKIILSNKEQACRIRYNGELIFCIKGIISHCSWYNKIIIYLDDKRDLFEILSEDFCKKNRIVPVEREKYFEPENFPTYSSLPIFTTIHKIPELSEYFIEIDDDTIINRPIEKGQWFSSDGKPYVIYADCICGHKLYNGQYNPNPIIPHPVYKNPQACKLKQPLTHGVYTHLPIPLKKSVCIDIAEEYPEWFSFVQSHKTRFKSTSGEPMWGCEECLFGVWTAYLLETKQGVPHFINKFDKNMLLEHPWCSEQDLVNYNPFFVNFNDATTDDNKYKLIKLMTQLTSKYNYLQNDENKWELELQKRLSLNKKSILKRNKRLLNQFQKRKEFYDFIIENDVDIILRDGYLLGAMRHNGYIDFGREGYGSGYDDDADCWALFSYRKQLIDLLKNTKFVYKDYMSFRAFCDYPLATQEHKNYYDKQPYINIDEPYGFQIFYDGERVMDGSFLYENGGKLIHISCWYEQLNIIKDVYKTDSRFGEKIYDRKDFFPKRKQKFYDTNVFVPNLAEKVLKSTYGENVFDVIFEKTTGSHGGYVSKTFNISGRHAPPVDIFNTLSVTQNEMDKQIEKMNDKFIIYKIGGSGFFHNLSGLSVAIDVAKQFNRTLIIEQYIDGVKRINFEKFIKIDEPELNYGYSYDVLPKDATWKGCGVEEIKSFEGISAFRSGGPPTAPNPNHCYYKGIDLSQIDRSEIDNQIIILCLYNPGFNTNIKISEQIMNRLEKEEKIEKPFISLHYRNTDMEHDIEPILEKISYITNNYNFETLYLASDDLSSYDKIKERFPSLEIVRKSLPPEGLKEDWSRYAKDKDKQLYEFLRDVYFILKSALFIPSPKSSVSRGIIQMIQEKKFIFSDSKINRNLKFLN